MLADLDEISQIGTPKKGVAVARVSRGGNVYALKYCEDLAGADKVGLNMLRSEIEITEALRAEAGYEYLIDSSNKSTELWGLFKWAGTSNIFTACKAESGPGRIRLIAGAARHLRQIYKAGFVHGDMQPAHIFVNGDDITVIDWGLAKRAGSTSKRRGAGIHYMPPEIADSLSGKSLAFNHSASEAYSLAATLFTAYTGKYPVKYPKGCALEEKYKIISGGEGIKSFKYCQATKNEKLEGLLREGLKKDPLARPSPLDLVTQLMRL